jgi:plasmid stabilization system protein ParE
MARAAREEGATRTTKAMAQIVYSPNALANLQRAFESLDELSPEAALAAVEAIRSAVGMLEHHPLIGRLVTGEQRELVISFGRSGYLARYRFLPSRGEVRILAIRHQRELGYP